MASAVDGTGPVLVVQFEACPVTLQVIVPAGRAPPTTPVTAAV